MRLLTQCNAAWTGASAPALVISLSVRTAVSRTTPVAKYNNVGRIATAPLKDDKENVKYEVDIWMTIEMNNLLR